MMMYGVTNAQPSPMNYYGCYKHPHILRTTGNYAYMPNAFLSQAIILSHAFQTMTPQDPYWNIDMGASSHLADNTGKHAKLPFYNSESSVESVFEIIHSDIWTSPISSESEIKYYAIFLDHFSHFVWVYPLHKKSDLFDNFVAFRVYVNKQFNVDIKALQCDHGDEYENTRKTKASETDGENRNPNRLGRVRRRICDFGCGFGYGDGF
nr:ribonuclease H-like domain-containing protein [Tanacetum cinerariifolium]